MRGRALCVGIACAILGCSRNDNRAGVTAAHPQRGKTYAVTLVTGDRVFYAVAADGTQSATVQPAPRAEGRPVAFYSSEWNGHLHVIPSDVAGDASIDPALFDVTQLVIERDDDESSSTLPLIVTSSEPAVRGTRALRMATSRELSSIGATALALPKANLAEQRELLSAVRSSAAPAQRRIWLDRRVRAVLDRSAPQIGAPTAWAQGFDGTGVALAVVDTGIDGTHPDLAGKVQASANFSGSGPGDHVGHGTHVASIIAGTGAASGGLRKGVAPGATLLDAKVLSDDGSGLSSAVISGMEWATLQQGARIVNLSLGGDASDGTDPVSQAVNDLTRRTGALFVIAAGNSGPATQSVSSPGAADEALTVGAVDLTDAVLFFSSRGPRLHDFAVKPEIVAPGNLIAAARAAGTSLGTVVDDHYVRASGTSMATPHVAGAAALLLQKHPGWSAPQLKAALVETAVRRDPAVSPFDQGAGRVDVPSALAQPVVATPAAISIGLLRWPQSGPTIHRTITFTNMSGSSTTLTLTASGSGVRTGAAATMVTLSASAVTVAANGTATVDLTVDPPQGTPDTYAGYVTAQGATGSLTVPFSFRKEPESYDLSVQGIARDGRPAKGSVWIVNVDDSTNVPERYWHDIQDTMPWRLEKGTYCIVGQLFTMDSADSQFIDVVLAPIPELSISSSQTLTLDARQATELLVETPGRETKKNENAMAGTAFYRTPVRGPTQGLHNIYSSSAVWKRLFMLPTAPVTKGVFEISARLLLEAPDIKMHVDPGLDLHPEYQVGSPRYDGAARFELADAGTGAATDVASRPLAGKIALLTRADWISTTDQANNAAAAGAVLAMVHNDHPGMRDSVSAPARIPVVLLSEEEGLELRGLLARGSVSVDVRAVARSPFRYDLVFPYTVVPQSLIESVSDARLATVTTTYHPPSAASKLLETRSWFRPGDPSAFTFTYDAPSQRIDYLLANDTFRQQLVFAQLTPPIIFTGAVQTYAAGQVALEDWVEQPLHPGVIETPLYNVPLGYPAVRNGDALSLWLASFVDAQGHFAFDDSGATTLRLYRNGSLVASAPTGFLGVGVPADPATYRLEVEVNAASAAWTDFSRRSLAAWTFQSRHTDSLETLPLVLIDVDIPLDAQNSAPRARDFAIGLRLRHQLHANQTAIVDAQASLSLDDGQTWRPATVSRLADGRWQATTDLTTAPDGSFGSLRLQATDIDGNRLDLDVLHAFAIGPRDDFALELDPPVARLGASGTASVRVSTRLTAGASQRITLAATGLPPDVTAKFDPPAISSGETSILTFSVRGTLGADVWPVRVTGAAPSVTREATVKLTALTVPIVAVTSPAPGTIPAGPIAVSAMATVSADTSLRRLTIEIDGVTVASDAVTPLVGSWIAEPGAHVIVARALDAEGRTGTSDEVRVTVTAAVGTGGGTGGGHPSPVDPPARLSAGGCNSADAPLAWTAFVALALLRRRAAIRRAFSCCRRSGESFDADMASKQLPS